MWVIHGEAVQLARESRGLTQSKLAAETSIAQASISKIERDEQQITEDTLKKIAKALDYPTAFFKRNIVSRGLGVSGIFHRKKLNIPIRVLRRIEAEFSIRVSEIRNLLHNVDIKSAYSFHHYDIDEYGNIEDIAEHVRAQWKMPLGPVKSVVGTIESAGGIVFKYDLGTKKLDAQSQYISGIPPIFFVNKSIPTDRMRFTLAHEIGHIVMHEHPTPNIETEANHFASAFLMPKDEILEELNPFSFKRAVSLKIKWKVSIASLIMRAFQLGVISCSQKRRYFTKLSALGYRTEEPIKLPDEEPCLIRKLIETCRVELGFSLNDFCDVLSINQRDFRTRYLGMPFLRLHSQ
ncbi:MAG: ImmA/IrrE family metallo-endopeptidase [Planctomycetes bacterium]|nr:ImmA/IrrE family metallo-endopeptidase [Planctomycetota bacterium]MCK5473112.1 ImmA/IrrE family metallo-endopeptidase [Planctomycetota bacterium]